MKKVLWVLVSCIMAFSLVFASCGNDEDETPPEDDTPVDTTEAPQYGGEITLVITAPEPDFDLINWFSTQPQHLAHQAIWEGDWTKGPAGGYGTNEVTWEDNTNIPDLFVGLVAEKWEFRINDDDTVTSIVTVRDNIYFQDTGTEASNLVKGRKMTVEDVAWCMDQHLSNPDAQNYQGFPETRDIPVTVTGPNTFEVTHPFNLHLDSIMRLFAYTLVFPPELWDEYGYDSCSDLTKSVGTGPYYISEYVPSNMVRLLRNDNYWETNPIGPGEGDKLPYADSVKYIIMPDLSTRLSALRTAQLDMMPLIAMEDAEYMEEQIPELMSARRGSGQINSAFFRMDLEPFNDIRVRQALMYGIDLDEINEGLYKGMGDLVSYPYFYTPAYSRLYLGLDDPEMPDSVKDLYTYNPQKAKDLLAEAGYPDGFETNIVLTADQADYYSIVKEHWAEIGVELNLKTVTDNAQLMSVNSELGFDGLIAQFISPTYTFPEQSAFFGPSWLNPSRVDDPYINETAAAIKAKAVTDFEGAMDMSKDMMKYLLEQVYAIPAPRYPNYAMWWPWVKNYTGEVNVGYMVNDNWVKWAWVDQDLKDEMGY